MAERRAKFGNVRVQADEQQHDGRAFDSVLERDVARVLDMLRSQGRLLSYERQVSYELAPAGQGQRACTYVCDFRVAVHPYRLGRTLRVLIECKGYMTQAARLKMRWFAQRYPELPLRVVHEPQEVVGVIEEFEQSTWGRKTKTLGEPEGVR